MAIMEKHVSHADNKKGFALIAAVMLLALFGLLLTSYNPTNSGSIRAKGQDSMRKMEVITKALQDYYEREGHYPCPASRTVTSGSVSFGEETSCTSPSTSCPAGVSCPSSSGSYVLIGTVPIMALQLPEQYMYDGWNNRLTYAVDLYRINGSGSPVLRIKNTSGTYMTNPPPYYLASLGPNAIGAYNKGGLVPSNKTCSSATTTDKTNCLGTGVEFISDKWDTTGGTKVGTDRMFDDIMANADRKAWYRCPAGVAGCSLWLDASDADGNGYAGDDTTSGSLATWVDKSGNGVNFTQSTAGSRPTIQSNIVNGKRVIRFDGSDDIMSNTVYMGTTKSTIFAVAKGNASGGHNRILHAGSSTDGIMFFGSYLGNFAAFYGNGSWNDTSANTRTISVTTDYRILSAVNDAGSTTTLAYPYVNGLEQNAKTGTTTTYTGLLLGGYGGGQYWDGDIAEVIVYNRALTDAERKKVENYLGEKYNLPSPNKCPVEIGGCKLWLDSYDPDANGSYATMLSAGTSVSQWLDRSGYGNNAVAPGVGNYPVAQTGTLGRSIRFDGTNDKLVISNSNINLGAYYTVIMAYKMASGATGRLLSGASDLGNNWLLGTWNGYATSHYAEGWLTYTNAADTNNHVVVATNNGSTSSFYIDGSLSTSNGSVGGWGANLVLGSWSNAENTFAEMGAGDIGEIIVYPYILTDAERNDIECYLSHKYSITVSGC